MIFAIIPVPAWAFVPGVILWDGYQLLTNPTVRISFSFMNSLDLTEYWQTTTDSAAHLGGIMTGAAYFLSRRAGIRL